MRRKVLYLQIAPPSREEVEAYQDLRARIDALCGRINGAYSDMDWTPIHYVQRNYRRDELAGMYRAAQVGLVTPLRDGMNLVAKEYVAAQDPDDPGVLVLSRFAGAARQMTEAVIVNPFSREELSEGLNRALSMERKERVRRWESLMEGVRRFDVKGWRDSFVAALEASHEPRLPLFESPTPFKIGEGLQVDGPEQAGPLSGQERLQSYQRTQWPKSSPEVGPAPLRHPEA
jgi:trehalose 6-phosphate synthase